MQQQKQLKEITLMATIRESVPSLVSLKDELDMDFAFADFGLSFLLSGEEGLTEKVVNERRETVPMVVFSENIACKTHNREKTWGVETVVEDMVECRAPMEESSYC